MKGIKSHELPRTKVISQLTKWVRRRGQWLHHHRASCCNCKENVHRSVTALQHSFRNATAFLVSHYLLLRGKSVRRLELADILLQELPKIGADGSYPIVTMIFNRSKTNQFNKVQSGAFMRNKNVAICAFMTLSFHFFWRWHHDNEPFPNFSCNANWFKIKLIHGARPNPVAKNSRRKGKAPARGNNDDESSDDDDNDWSSNPFECPISKASQARFMKAAFDSINLFVRRKITHVPRGSATKMADNLGVPSSQIGRMGQWSQDVMSNSYLNSTMQQMFNNIVSGRQPLQLSARLEKSSASALVSAPVSTAPVNKMSRGVYTVADLWK
ncbi:hypothetical protein [Parasitella parasitica]|uniref:Ndc10 domain-containing protein n=1 Tax=Parasitella parasitica TaxID=35722 RepID=A0A0B7NGM2_9FUNG|nr:hypothetical protein [Parasitella parasitica]